MSLARVPRSRDRALDGRLVGVPEVVGPNFIRESVTQLEAIRAGAFRRYTPHGDCVMDSDLALRFSEFISACLTVEGFERCRWVLALNGMKKLHAPESTQI